jgi:hypothetical protein
MLRRVALLRTDVSEALSSSETSILITAIPRNIQEDTILHSHRRENIKSYQDLPNFPLGSPVSGVTTDLLPS